LTISSVGDDVHHMLEHIRYLSVSVGGRGSCTAAERQAAQYAVDQMEAMGVQDAHLEFYQGSPSTYRPYMLAFGAAFLGSLVAWLGERRAGLALAALLNILGLVGMLAETDFAPNWMRLLLPRATSQNAVGVIPAAMQPRRRVVLCAHVDSHRTPIFYSTPTWRRFFQLLVSTAYLNMAVGGAFFAVGALLGVTWVRWLGLIIALVQLCAVLLCLHADFTPFSPGANDNASGVGVILEIARRLVRQPLDHTEVWLAFTGCEETGASGMSAFLDSHAKSLGDEAVYIILDEAGLGVLQYLTDDGLVIKRPTHPLALELARRVEAGLPGVKVIARGGIAYTDAAVATKRKLIALSLGCLPEAQPGQTSHWHQLSDTIDTIDPRALGDAMTYTWHLLRQADQ